MTARLLVVFVGAIVVGVVAMLALLWIIGVLADDPLVREVLR